MTMLDYDEDTFEDDGITDTKRPEKRGSDNTDENKANSSKENNIIPKSPPAPRKLGVDPEMVAKKYFLSPPPNAPSPPPRPPTQFRKDTPFLEALQSCETMECVRDAHYQPKAGAKFNYPHFLIIGFQKAATTSLHVYVNILRFISLVHV